MSYSCNTHKPTHSKTTHNHIALSFSFSLSLSHTHTHKQPHARMHARTHTHRHTHTQHTHTHTHTHTHVMLNNHPKFFMSDHAIIRHPPKVNKNKKIETKKQQFFSRKVLHMHKQKLHNARQTVRQTVRQTGRQTDR